MRYLAAYLLSSLGGNKEPSVDDISSILSSVGIEIDNERAKKVVNDLKGKDLAQLIAAGSEKLATVPSGGGGGAAPAAAGGDDKAGSPAKEAKSAKKEEEKEESDDDMGFGLFD
ncbi:ribosomal protein LP2 [Brevipalpus obovatus]|uniref:ribosomal protein LP2 n=1 Tax=Brevipalpus obovatus TaxID=246614 RepID=UPI003D9FB08F